MIKTKTTAFWVKRAAVILRRMNPADPNVQDQNQPPEVQVHNPLNTMREGERNIFEVRRHPIGLFGMYFSAGLLLVVVGVLALGVAPTYLTNYNKSSVMLVGLAVFLVVALFTLIFVAIGHKVYWGNRWILTTDSLTQVQQRGLFDKQSGQLSLGNLEDVTAVQDGMLAHMFNFGVLRAETAGERSKFVFAFCPNPNYYAQQVLSARENFEQGRRGDPSPQRPYRSEGSYQTQIDNQPAMPAQPAQSPVLPPSEQTPPADYPGVNINTEEH